MIKAFKHLNEEEQTLLYKAPVMVTILIAGADDDISEREKDAAAKMIKYKTLAGDTQLMKFYSTVNKTFEETLYEMINEYPKRAEDRNPVIAEELGQLNSILPRLDKNFAIAYYKNLKSYGKKIAESSGGFLGFMSVGAEEKPWIDLPMVNDPSTY